MPQQTLTLADSATNSVSHPQTVSHTTSGTAASGFGVGHKFNMENAAGNTKSAGFLDVIWSSASDGAEYATFSLKAMENGAAADEMLSIAADGAMKRAFAKGDVKGNHYTKYLTLQTTNATPGEAVQPNGARLTIPANATWAFTMLVAARKSSSTQSAAYELKGCIKRDTDSTTIVGSVTKTVLAEDAAGWDVAVTADDTNEALILTVTGAAATTIEWRAMVNIVSVEE